MKFYQTAAFLNKTMPCNAIYLPPMEAVEYCTYLYGSNRHGHDGAVALLVFGIITITVGAVALKKS
jgi:hypothetical protein